MANTLVETRKDEQLPVANAGLQQGHANPSRPLEFLHDVRAEMHKVTTPTATEVQSTTIVVLIAVFLFAAYFWVVDFVLGAGIDQIFKWAAKH
jgi:preprotein translocase subunit SecE